MKHLTRIFILALICFQVFAQEKIVESVRVEYTTIPIFVVDQEGEPILDLKNDEIEVFVNNRKISPFNFLKKAFFTTAQQQEVKAGTDKSLPDERKTIVLLFDTAASKAGAIMRMRTIAKQILMNTEQNCCYILMCIKPFKGLQYIAGPLTDRDKTLSIIKDKIAPVWNFRSVQEELEFAYGRGCWQPTETRGAVSEDGGDLDALYLSELQKRSKSYLMSRNDSLARAFEELYYALNTIKGTKFLYLFTEGFAESIGTRFYGVMVEYFLRTGAVSFIVNPSGGMGNSVESGEPFLKALAELAGSKYIYGSKKSIARRVKNIHHAYYELAFEVPEDLIGVNYMVTVKPLRANANIYIPRFLENKRKYCELKEIEKQLLALNLATKKPIFNVEITPREAQLLDIKKNEGNVIYRFRLPGDFPNGNFELFKIYLPLPGSKETAIVDRVSASPVAGEMEINFKIKPGYGEYFVLIGGDAKSALVQGMSDPGIVIDNVSFKDNQLHFNVSGYLKDEIENEAQNALLNLNIIIRDKKNNVFYKGNKLLPVKQNLMDIVIPFKEVPRGTYNVLITVNDLFTKREQKYAHQLEI